MRLGSLDAAARASMQPANVSASAMLAMISPRQALLLAMAGLTQRHGIVPHCRRKSLGASQCRGQRRRAAAGLALLGACDRCLRRL